ncbi:MAG: 3-deoxy-D-manno-octulosonic acid transferase [Bacteroidetes bacterium]|nr:3-deoxy-D-manno-octulosonic acid transferase [Bacteroidota bacterium]
MKVLYASGVWLYTVMVHLVSWWNPKARKWVNGRKETWDRLEKFTALQPAKENDRLFWFHCASLGEFEQGRPLIEALKAQSACKIAVSFFSPSGYEIRKNYEHADLIFYLPVDTKKNAARLMNQLKPAAVFFIKYEFWANYIFEAKRQNIPCYSVSAVFRENQVFFKWYGGYMRTVLKSFTALFVQNEQSQILLKKAGIQAIVSGDTRYDRVMKNAEKAQRFPAIDAFVKDHLVFVCGSLWQPDLAVVSSGLNKLGKAWKIILTTHEITEHHLSEAEAFFSEKKCIRFSKLTDQDSDADVLVIDNVGMLMHLYGYANLAYVGGAFKTGLHNILEPASFGLPVIFGPRYKKFPEAELFIQSGIGFSISDASEFEAVCSKLQQENLREKVLQFMNSQQGATRRILEKIH